MTLSSPGTAHRAHPISAGLAITSTSLIRPTPRRPLRSSTPFALRRLPITACAGQRFASSNLLSTSTPSQPPQHIQRRVALLSIVTIPVLPGSSQPAEASPVEAEKTDIARPRFQSLDGISVLKLRDSGSGVRPNSGDEVEINFTARLASKQGWYFENTYQHKGRDGFPVPYTFTVGDGSVIAGLEAAVLQMQKGDVLRAVIPPPLSYQNTSQGPVPQEWSNRRRLYSTIFNEVRMANDPKRAGAASCADVEASIPGASAAECSETVRRVVAVVNEAYSCGEEGMWRGASAERCSAGEVEALLRAGKLTVLTSAGCIVGSVCVDTAAGELGMLAVAGTHRGCGLGWILVEEAERRCREAGATNISLQLLTPVDYEHPNKVWLERWYVSLGYEKADRVDFASLYPRIAPLLACKCHLTTYVKQLGPRQPSTARVDN